MFTLILFKPQKLPSVDHNWKCRSVRQVRLRLDLHRFRGLWWLEPERTYLSVIMFTPRDDLGWVGSLSFGRMCVFDVLNQECYLVVEIAPLFRIRYCCFCCTAFSTYCEPFFALCEPFGPSDSLHKTRISSLSILLLTTSNLVLTVLVTQFFINRKLYWYLCCRQ